MGILDTLASLQQQVTDLSAAIGRHRRVPEMRWGTVTTLTPTIVTFPEGGTAQITRSSETVWVGAQVLVQIQGLDRWIVSLRKGSGAGVLPHAEFTGTVSLTNATQGNLGTLTLDATNSPDTGLVDSPSAGVIRFINPGLYAVTVAVNLQTVPTGECFVGWTSPSGLITRGHDTANDRFSASDSSLYIPSANFSMGTDLYQTSGATRTLLSRIAVTRVT